MKSLLLAGLLLVCLVVVTGKKGKDIQDLKNKSVKKIHSNTHDRPGHSRNGRYHKRLRGSHLMLREGGLKSLHNDAWKDLPKKNKDCKTKKCGHKEFCLVNPQNGDEKCISRKQFKKGRRLFTQYHKEKEFLRQDRKHVTVSPVTKGDQLLKEAEHMKDVYDLVHDTKMESHHKHHKHLKNKSERKPELNHIEEGKTNSEECRPSEMYELRERLVGWFVMLHTESRQRHHMKNKDLEKKNPHLSISTHGDVFGAIDKKRANGMLGKDVKKHFLEMETKSKKVKRSTHNAMQIETETHHHCKCSKSAMWEFHKLDEESDHHLTHPELARMESLKREPCLKALFMSCDTDKDGLMSQGEWCCCMANTIPPCAEKKRLTDPAVWDVRCDKEGFFEREQCHEKTGYCWCVDLNGNEIHGTKQHGSAHCGKYDPNGHLFKA
ncbi:TICN2-like protein [Mya arenaria]|uniref:TICN2-like protein n=1 Tax=Mya arenaria TaxID=6604 RepID=A0ABY7DHT8_MYAAR|nr:uncharacterized protein LOC128222528 [Mya arenaria]WAQ96272.1 TICN2-like protein [Mya arenaria]